MLCLDRPNVIWSLNLEYLNFELDVHMNQDEHDPFNALLRALKNARRRLAEF
jgi:hypothetical protein